MTHGGGFGEPIPTVITRTGNGHGTRPDVLIRVKAASHMKLDSRLCFAASSLLMALACPAVTSIVGTTTISDGVTPGTVLNNSGDLRMAVNFGTFQTPTINGVTFGTSFLPTFNGATVSSSGISLTANYETHVPPSNGWRNVDWTGLWSTPDVWQPLFRGLTDSGHSDQPNGEDINFSASGLDISRIYRVQLLFGDTRTGPGFPPESVFLLDFDGQFQNVTVGGGGLNDGMIVEVLVSGAQGFTFNLENNQNLPGHDPAFISGLVIHDIGAVPEPTGAALAGAAAVGLLSRRRRFC